MLWLLFISLLFLWLAGVVANYLVGGLVHLLLVLAVLVLAWQLIRQPDAAP